MNVAERLRFPLGSASQTVSGSNQICSEPRCFRAALAIGLEPMALNGSIGAPGRRAIARACRFAHASRLTPWSHAGNPWRFVQQNPVSREQSRRRDGDGAQFCVGYPRETLGYDHEAVRPAARRFDKRRCLAGLVGRGPARRRVTPSAADLAQQCGRPCKPAGKLARDFLQHVTGQRRVLGGQPVQTGAPH